MSIQVHFCFNGNLHDFLRPAFRQDCFVQSCPGTSIVKDAIEAVGVPHVEVSAVCINGTFEPFEHPLQADAKVVVYPLRNHPVLPEGYSLHESLPARPTFI